MNDLDNKSRKYFRLYVSFVILVVCCTFFYILNYTGKVAELKRTCDQLKKNEPEINHYEVIIGRYVHQKSFTSVEHPSGMLPIYTGVITLENDGKEYALYSEEMIKEEYEDSYQPLVKRVFSNNNSNPEQSVYGICAYKMLPITKHLGSESKVDKFISKIETLTLIEKGKNK